MPPLHCAVSLQPDKAWYPSDFFSNLNPGDGFDEFFNAVPKDARAPHAPLVSKAVAAVLDPRIDVTFTPAAYAEFKANWTTNDSNFDMRVDILLWTVCNKVSKNCYSATDGKITFDDAALGVTIVPAQPTYWHRIAQLQEAAAPKLFKPRFVVGA